jgi:hypothetical protein
MVSRKPASASSTAAALCGVGHIGSLDRWDYVTVWGTSELLPQVPAMLFGETLGRAQHDRRRTTTLPAALAQRHAHHRVENRVRSHPQIRAHRSTGLAAVAEGAVLGASRVERHDAPC